MNIRNITAALAATLILVSGTARAAIVPIDSNDPIVVDGTSYKLVTDAPDYSGLMWEETQPGSGVYKTCLCSMFSFRALQALAQFLDLDNLDKAAITIVSGWNTDGPEHIFVDSMGWDGGSTFSYTDPITASSELTLEDAWITFTVGGTTYKVSSLAENYSFTDDTDHPGYRDEWDFFDYRTHFKTTSETDDAKNYFRDVIRSQVVANFTDGAAFDVTPVPVPAPFFCMGIGLVSMVLMGRRRSAPSARHKS